MAILPSSSYNVQYDFTPLQASLAAIASLGAAKARNEANNAKRKAFIESGVPDIAAAYGADPNTVEASKQNPFSALALLHREGADRTRSLKQALNSENLFYSSEMARQLGKQAFGQSQAETDFVGKLRNLVSGIDRGVLDADQREISAQTTAAPPVAPGAPPAAPSLPEALAAGGGSTPPLPTWSGQTQLPTWSGQTQLPTFNAGTPSLPPFGSTVLPPFNPANTRLPKPPSGYRNLFNDLPY